MEHHLHQQEDPLVAFNREKQNKKHPLHWIYLQTLTPIYIPTTQCHIKAKFDIQLRQWSN